MAIGKAGAYATVEGPKVDFGDIALNAQKIQQADLDRMKSMIPEKEKSDFKVKDFDAGVKKTGNGGYDQTITSHIDDVLVENLAIDNEAQSLGRYTPELMARKQKLQNEVTSLKGLAEKFTADAIVFSKDLSDGKLSSVDKSRFDIFEDIAAKRNLEISKDNDGNTVFKVRMVDGKGNYLSDDKGNKLFKKFNDRGVERDTISKYELENGSLFGNTIKELDRTKTIDQIQNNIQLRTTVTDRNGVSRTVKDLSADDYSYINSSINGVLSNYDNLASYLYSLDRDKYANPKTLEQYKKDGDIDFAANQMKKGILAGLGFEVKEQKDNVQGGAKGGDGLGPKGIVKSIIPNTISQYVASDVGEFYNVQEAKANISGGTVFGLKKNKKGENVKYNLPSGSVLNGFTVGKNGSALIRVFVPTSKSSQMIKNKQRNMLKQVASGQITQSDADFELSSYSTGLDGTMQYYYAPETTINTMLPKGVDYTEVIKSIRNTRTPNIR